jgi:uncharacterized protein YyaL (SSP411 family)
MPDVRWPTPTLKQLRRLTDDCGVIQHAKFWFPDYATGYCADDNSRALMVAQRYYRLFHDDAAHELMVRYLAFLFYVQRRDGKIRNFIDYSRAFMEEEGSPDSLGRTVWALGGVSTMEEDYLSVPAQEMFHRAIAHITPASVPHALAYALLGLSAYAGRPAFLEEARQMARPLAAALLTRYHSTRSEEWDWFLPVLTYANGRLPQALLRAGTLLEHEELLAAGLQSLQFLNRVSYVDEYLSVIGCHGWYPRGGRRAVFDQQPIDAGAMVDVNLDAFRLTGEVMYEQYAVTAMEWFYGRNVLQIPLYNCASGGCHDGLSAAGVNANQGAESTLAYLMAQLALYAHRPELFADHRHDEAPQPADMPSDSNPAS